MSKESELMHFAVFLKSGSVCYVDAADLERSANRITFVHGVGQTKYKMCYFKVDSVEAIVRVR